MGGIQALGSSSRTSSVLSQRASARSVLALRLRPRSARSLGDLCEVDLVAFGLEFLDAEAPAGRCLDRDLDLLPVETAEPVPQSLPRRRCDPAPLHLAGGGVEGVVGDLRTVNVESNYHRHRGLLTLRL